MQTRTYAIGAALITAGLLGGIGAYVLVGDSGPETVCPVGESTMQIGGPFTLIDAQGRSVTDKDVITRPSLIYFGYTFCPDVCPLDTVRNAEAVDILAERGHDVQPVFISVDWRRDTPQSVGDFASNLHPDMIGLTGSQEQVRAASAAYRTYFKAGDTADEYFLIDHSTFTYLALPDEGVIGFYRRELSGEQLADAVSCVLENR